MSATRAREELTHWFEGGTIKLEPSDGVRMATPKAAAKVHEVNMQADLEELTAALSPARPPAPPARASSPRLDAGAPSDVARAHRSRG